MKIIKEKPKHKKVDFNFNNLYQIKITKQLSRLKYKKGV